MVGIDEVIAEPGANRSIHGAMFEKLDTDGNGMVSAAEFAARPMRGMERFDTDGDGMVSDEEREAARAAMKDHRDMWGRHGGMPATDAPDGE